MLPFLNHPLLYFSMPGKQKFKFQKIQCLCFKIKCCGSVSNNNVRSQNNNNTTKWLAITWGGESWRPCGQEPQPDTHRRNSPPPDPSHCQVVISWHLYSTTNNNQQLPFLLFKWGNSNTQMGVCKYLLSASGNSRKGKFKFGLRVGALCRDEPSDCELVQLYLSQ